MDRLICMEAFVRVAEAGSFAEAARRWGCSKAAVSKQVGQLEAALGVRLLQRTTRTLSLTDAGQAHLERCQQILGQVEEAEARLRADHVAPAGRLRVSAPPGLMTLHSRLLSGFVERYPAVTLDLELTHRMIDLVEERIDVALRMTKPGDTTLVARRLAPAPLAAVASPDHLRQHGVPPGPAALAGRPCIMDTNFRFHPRWPFRVGEQRLSVEVAGPVQVNSPTLVRDLVLDGVGIGLIPAMLVAPELASGRLVELFPGQVDVDWSLYAVTSQRRHLSARATAFIQHTMSYFRSLEPTDPRLQGAWAHRA